MRLAFVYPTLPPVTNGIGDYTMAMGAELVTRGNEVLVLCSRPGDAARRLAADAGIELIDVWPDGDLTRLERLVEVVTDRAPAAVVLEFEQFSYGRRGFNPRFSGAFHILARRSPSVARVLMLHEAQVGIENWRTLVMLSYQRLQLLRLVKYADRILMSTDAWRPLLPADARRRADVAPIPSNLPFAAASTASRERVRVGIFGSVDARRAPYLRAALQSLEASAGSVEFAYVGPHRERLQELLDPNSRIPTSLADVLPAQDAAEFVASQDLILAPYAEGITSRRTSVSAALLMGRAVLTTIGRATDELSKTAIRAGALKAVPADDPSEFGRAAGALVSEPETLAQLGDAGASYYRAHLDVSIGAQVIERAAQWKSLR